MLGKYYTFRAGQSVPAWLLSPEYHAMTRQQLVHNKHHGKVVFRRSCVVIRGDSQHLSKVMPANNTFGQHSLIVISNYHGAVFRYGSGCTGVATCEGPVAHLESKHPFIKYGA